MTEIVESDGVELEPISRSNLFGARDPVEVLPEAARIAAAFKDTIDAAGMIQRIGAREHVLVEGWQTLGAMLGIQASIVWSRPIEGGWEARAEASTIDGRVVGAAEAMCTRAERNWARRDEFQIRSMAQTRAMSRALRAPLGFVMTLAGLEATAPEEMAAAEPEPAPLPSWAKSATNEQVLTAAGALVDILKAAGTPEPAKGTAEVGRRVRERCDGEMPVVVLTALEAVRDVIGTALSEEAA